MTVNDHFNAKRMYLLFKRNTVMSYKNILIASAALLGISFLFSMIAVLTNTPEDLHESLYLPLLWLGGLVFTSMVFKEAHSRNQIHNWLMTPASTFEKFLEKLLLSTVFYALFTVIIYSLVSLLNTGLVFLFFRKSLPLFNPFQLWVWENIGHYIIIQSLFFLGAAWFRRYNFIKTILSINIIQFIFLILLGTVFIMVYKEPLHTGFQMHMGGGFGFPNQMWSFNNSSVWINNSLTVLKVFYNGFMAPFFWFLAWVRLRELEVKDGI